MAVYPALRQVVLDAVDVRGLAEFYRELLGYQYRPGDEGPLPDGGEHDWLVLAHPSGAPRLAFQQVAELPATTWPAATIPQQLHLDLSVGSKGELGEQHARVIGLGARLLLDEFDDEQEPLRVYADPAGHPFCIFVPPVG